ncbi:hypothetical protein DL769_008377 [Monosporascus sp. CRB-8-3]|nr:hypothetical protein DL769_008377 [Monosporascus sp. CRB-8-3]
MASQDVLATRVLFLLLETTFQYGFWTMMSHKDYGVPMLQPSNAKQLEYRGLNSRPATCESSNIKDVLVPADELAKAIEAAKQRYKEYINSPESYRQSPAFKAWERAYHQSPTYKALQEKYKEAQNSPAGKAKLRAYRQRPDVRARMIAYRQSPEVKARQKIHNECTKSRRNMDDYNANRRKRDAERYGTGDITSGTLTPEQIEQRALRAKRRKERQTEASRLREHENRRKRYQARKATDARMNCPYCKKDFARRCNLTAHIELKHEEKLAEWKAAINRPGKDA